MPNNIVFNPVADQLKTLVYGQSSTGTVTALLTDNTGILQTTLQNASITVVASDLNIRALSYTTDYVTVESVVDTVNVNAVVTDTVNIRVLSYTTDYVTVESVVDTVNVNAVVTNTVDIRPLSQTIDYVSDIVSGRVFTSITDSINNVTGTGNILTEDTSQQRVYSFYVYNTGPAAISVKLQISPTTDPSYFMDDPSGEQSVVSGDKKALVAARFLNYTRLAYDTGTSAASAIFYYNAQI